MKTGAWDDYNMVRIGMAPGGGPILMQQGLWTAHLIRGRQGTSDQGDGDDTYSIPLYRFVDHHTKAVSVQFVQHAMLWWLRPALETLH